LVINGLFDGHRRFLNSLGRSNDPLAFQIVGIILHIGWCRYFVTIRNLGIVGIGYASTISNITVYLSLLIYSACIPSISEAITMPDRKTFVGIG
jgi:Na+-driven multidrug efflux pump